MIVLEGFSKSTENQQKYLFNTSDFNFLQMRKMQLKIVYS